MPSRDSNEATRRPPLADLGVVPRFLILVAVAGAALFVYTTWGEGAIITLFFVLVVIDFLFFGVLRGGSGAGAGGGPGGGGDGGGGG